MNKKHTFYAALAGLLIYILHLALVWVIGPIVGLSSSGFLYSFLKISDYSIGLPLLLVEYVTSQFGCVTFPCMYLDLTLAFFVYPLLAILVYYLICFLRNLKK